MSLKLTPIDNKFILCQCEGISLFFSPHTIGFQEMVQRANKLAETSPAKVFGWLKRVATPHKYPCSSSGNLTEDLDTLIQLHLTYPEEIKETKIVCFLIECGMIQRDAEMLVESSLFQGRKKFHVQSFVPRLLVESLVAPLSKGGETPLSKLRQATEGKTFWKALKGVSPVDQSPESLLKALKAVNSALTHVLIEAELNPDRSQFLLKEAFPYLQGLFIGGMSSYIKEDFSSCLEFILQSRLFILG